MSPAQQAQFLRYARNAQIESNLWYSAYPDISIARIDGANATCQDLQRSHDAGGAGFLADLQRLISNPMTIVELDIALQRLSSTEAVAGTPDRPRESASVT
jgi:hypothetical protein